MLTLKDATIIGAGMERSCYLHPEDRNMVIKISRRKDHKDKHNLCEHKTYNYLVKHHTQLDFISRCYGFIDTDLGPGLVCQCVRDYDGEISKTLLQLLGTADEKCYSTLKALIGGFCAHLVENNIQLFDLNPKNIVIQRQQPHHCKAVAIDLKGRYANKECIPYSTFIPFFSRKKLHRRGRRLVERMDHIRENYDDFIKEHG